MPRSPSSLRVTLFYSYSHKDVQHKNDMETILDTLRQRALLKGWSDAEITPGRSISEALQAKQSESDIFAFLFSPAFLASEECRKEWDRAKELAASGRLVFRVPIIVRDCPWQDFLGDDDVKALPTDGKAVTAHQDRDSAWNEVYEGIKSVVESLRATFTAKPAFLTDLRSADLPSARHVSLEDIFVFPRLIEYDYTAGPDLVIESPISSTSQILNRRRSMIHGEDRSGKTALAKHLVLSLINDGRPVLFADLGTVTSRLSDKYLRGLYEGQFNGDYYLWKQQQEKTLIIDNVTDAPKILEFLEDCSETFSHIYLFVSSDVFHSFFADEIRLADFDQIRIEPLTHARQEKLIRKRLATLEIEHPVTDGFVDQAEDRVNSIIISNKIVPRYPFFVLSILQTYDALMPQPLPITSYGHCYYVLIVASLLRAGISETDDAVNASFNFAEQLAWETFTASREAAAKPFDFAAFQEQYRTQFFMEKSLLSRLTHKEYGIITSDGEFKTAYMYYFFLGKVLATNPERAEAHLDELCDRSYDHGSFLTLLFAIHHATDNKTIDDIVVRTMVELDDTAIATLRESETSRFRSIVSELPESVLSGDSVEKERTKERDLKETIEDQHSEPETPQDIEDERDPHMMMLRVLKNNKLLGQVLRNQYGKLPKTKIEEIVETITDSSLRVVNLMSKDEDEIQDLALHVHARWPDMDLGEVQQVVRLLSFVWTMVHIEQAVSAVSVPGIRDAVEAVVTRNGTPAYDIFGYFYELDSAATLTRNVRDKLDRLYTTHSDDFVKRVLSIRTQWYMNTHHSKTNIEQSICSVLGIPYRPRLKSVETTIA